MREAAQGHSNPNSNTPVPSWPLRILPSPRGLRLWLAGLRCCTGSADTWGSLRLPIAKGNHPRSQSVVEEEMWSPALEKAVAWR